MNQNRIGGAARPTQPQMRLTPRGKKLLGAILGAALLPMLGIGARAAASEPDAPAQVVLYSVQPGDNFWRLARKVADPGEDLRDVIQELQSLNHLRNVDLRVGQTILLPVR